MNTQTPDTAPVTDLPTLRDLFSSELWTAAVMACLAVGMLGMTSLLFAEEPAADKKAEEKKVEEKKDPPVVKTIVPLGIVDGMTVSLTVRGFKLSEVTEIKFPEMKTAPVYKIKSKGAAPAANKVPTDKIGDTQVELELTLPVDTPAGMTTFVLIGPNGQSEPRKLMILESAKTTAEKEPNDGFPSAQEMTLGQTITGTMAAGQNADVFRFTGDAGQRLRIEIQATQHGSPLDPFVLLHNENGQLLAEIDDGPTGSDPVIEIALPKQGQYFISILDAHELASPVHAYLLRTKVE